MRWQDTTIYRFAIAALIGSLCAACGGSDPRRGAQAVIPVGYVQVVNAIPDAPVLDVRFNVRSLSLAYAEASAISEVAVGPNTIEVSYTNPRTDETQVLIEQFEIDVGSDDVFTVVLRGTFASADALVLEKPFGNVADEDSVSVEVGVVNLTSSAADVFFGDVDEDIATAPPLFTVLAGEATEPDTITYEVGEFERTLRLRVTDAGTTDVRYDSGGFVVPVRARTTIVIVDSLGPDSTTKSTFVLTESGAASFANEIAPTAVRLLNALADEASVTVNIVDEADAVVSTQAADFTGVSAFDVIDAGSLDVRVEVASDPGVTAATAPLELSEDTFYTVVVSGSSVEDAIDTQAIFTSTRPIANSSKILFVQTLRETDVEGEDRVDLYVLDDGEVLADVDPLLFQVPYQGTANITIPTNTYDIVLTTTGTESVIAGPLTVDLGSLGSIVLIAAEAAGGGTPSQLVVQAEN
jgi:hypothetical protein